MTPPVCPRCGGPVRPPGLFSSDWRCDEHGAVLPLHVLPKASPEAVGHVRAAAAVPFWAPSPLLPGWTVTGVGYAGDERTRARATLLACAGPAPLGGVADMVLIAEEPGCGVGAGYAGLPEANVSPDLAGPAVAKVIAAGHPTALWTVSEAPPDRAVLAGEALGVWLWAVLWPAEAGYVLLEHVVLADLRERMPADLVVGAPSPYLVRRRSGESGGPGRGARG
ncbi:MAG TPA: DUF6758 family protein [Mycobacteriales bacterium]